MSTSVDPTFAVEIARTLRDEIGARRLYGRLAQTERDDELARLFLAFADEGRSIENDVRALMRELDTAGRTWSPRRWVAAQVWGLLARLGMRRFVLRLCLESEEVLARRYSAFAHGLARAGCIHAALRCENLATAKATQAQALRAWVPA